MALRPDRACLLTPFLLCGALLHPLAPRRNPTTPRSVCSRRLFLGAEINQFEFTKRSGVGARRRLSEQGRSGKHFTCTHIMPGGAGARPRLNDTRYPSLRPHTSASLYNQSRPFPSSPRLLHTPSAGRFALRGPQRPNAFRPTAGSHLFPTARVRGAADSVARSALSYSVLRPSTSAPNISRTRSSDRRQMRDAILSTGDSDAALYRLRTGECLATGAGGGASSKERSWRTTVDTDRRNLALKAEHSGWRFAASFNTNESKRRGGVRKQASGSTAPVVPRAQNNLPQTYHAALQSRVPRFVNPPNPYDIGQAPRMDSGLARGGFGNSGGFGDSGFGDSGRSLLDASSARNNYPKTSPGRRRTRPPAHHGGHGPPPLSPGAHASRMTNSLNPLSGGGEERPRWSAPLQQSTRFERTQYHGLLDTDLFQTGMKKSTQLFSNIRSPVPRFDDVVEPEVDIGFVADESSIPFSMRRVPQIL